MLVKTETVATAPTGAGKITLGISTSGVAKIADYRIYESTDVLNITEQYSSLGNVGVLDVFGNHLTEYDIKENKVGKGYLSLNQNNVKTKIFNNTDNVVITYKFKGTEQDKYYPIIQFTDYINGIIAPKVEITMKTTKLFVSVIIDNSLIEKEYDIDCTTLKAYSISINTDKSIIATEAGSALAHTPGELIALYSFENTDTANDQNVVNLVGESILSNMTICNIELSTKAVSGTTQQTAVDIVADGDNYHYYEIKESGTLTFAKETRVDMVLIGGGAGGGKFRIKYEENADPNTWDEANTFAIGKGGRLPTKQEMIDYLDANGRIAETNMWAPIYDTTISAPYKHWIQVGIESTVPHPTKQTWIEGNPSLEADWISVNLQSSEAQNYYFWVEGTEYYGEPGEVNVISTYLEGTYQIEIGSGGESNMPGSKSTIVDTNTGLEVYSANGGLTNVEYIDTTYSNVYSTYCLLYTSDAADE